MGWWKVAGSSNIVGDGPLDALNGAVDAVVSQYEQAHGRRPAKEEWAALLTAVLASVDSTAHSAHDGRVVSVRVE